MGLASRLGLILLNLLVLLPVFILLIASAIISSIVQSGLGNLTDQNPGIVNAHKYIRGATITLWVLIALGFFGAPFTGGLVSLSYLFAFFITILVILNLTLAGFFFYTAAMIKDTADYKKGTDESKGLYARSIGIAVAMVVASLFLLIYTIWATRRYRAEGGLSGDVGTVSELALALETGGATELAPELRAAALYGKSYGDKNVPVGGENAVEVDYQPIVDYFVSQKAKSARTAGALDVLNTMAKVATNAPQKQLRGPPPPPGFPGIGPSASWNESNN